MVFFSNSASYWLDALEFFSGLPKNINNSYCDTQIFTIINVECVYFIQDITIYQI